MDAELFTDPACPFGYSANPAFRAIEWRYRNQITWRLRMIGLSDDTSDLDEKGLTPGRLSQGQVDLRDRHGMPFSVEPKIRNAVSGPACRAVVAVGLLHPGLEWQALKALQLLGFTTPMLIDLPDHLREALATVPGVDPDAVLEAAEGEEVKALYAEDHAAARQAEQRAGHLQGKTAGHEGGQRYTAPSVIFSKGGVSLEAAGFQPVEAYDVLIANLDPALERHEPPEDPMPALELYPAGLTTQEVTAIMSDGLNPASRVEVEKQLVELVANGSAKRVAMGSDAIWMPA